MTSFQGYGLITLQGHSLIFLYHIWAKTQKKRIQALKKWLVVTTLVVLHLAKRLKSLLQLAIHLALAYHDWQIQPRSRLHHRRSWSALQVILIDSVDDDAILSHLVKSGKRAAIHPISIGIFQAHGW